MIGCPIIVVGVRRTREEFPGKALVHRLLNRVAQAACIFTAGSRELLGSQVAGKTLGTVEIRCPFLFRGNIAPSGLRLRGRASPGPLARFTRGAPSPRSVALAAEGMSRAAKRQALSPDP